MAKVLSEYVGFEHPETREMVIILKGDDTNGKGAPADLLKVWKAQGMVEPDKVSAPKPEPKPESKKVESDGAPRVA